MSSTPAAGKPADPSVLQIVSRIVAGVGGGWAFTWGVVVLCISLLVAAGVPYDDARTFLYLLAFVLFLVLFLWAFAAKSLLRVWVVLAGGSALMTGAAWWVSRSLV